MQSAANYARMGALAASVGFMALKGLWFCACVWLGRKVLAVLRRLNGR